MRILNTAMWKSVSILLICIFSFVSCSLWQAHVDEKAKAEQLLQMRRLESSELEQVQSAFERSNFESALNGATAFQVQHPNSELIFSSRLIQGKALIRLQQEEKAEKVLRDLSASSRASNPEIAAECFFWLGNLYLQNSKDNLATAAYLDADRLKEYLPDEMKMAELPVRLAVLSARFGDWPKAQAYLQEAEMGIANLIRARPNVDQKWIAELYLKMGSATYVEPDLETYSIAIKTMRVSQVQLLRAVALNQQPSAQQAMDLLIQAYDEFWNVSQSYKAPTGLDSAIRVKMQKSARLNMSVEFLELIKDLKLWFPFGEQSRNQMQIDFESFAKFKEDLAFRAIHKEPFDQILTKDSEVSPLQKSPPKINSQLKSEDPNM